MCLGEREALILSLSESPELPYCIRTLVIEAPMALVARRDSTGIVNAVGGGKGTVFGIASDSDMVFAGGAEFIFVV